MGLFTTDDGEPEHDMAARVLLPAFSLEGMKDYFGIISECTQILTNVMGERCSGGATEDVHVLLSQYTFEIINRVCFGKQADAMTNPAGCVFLKHFDTFGACRARMSKR